MQDLATLDELRDRNGHPEVLPANRNRVSVTFGVYFNRRVLPDSERR